MKLSEQYPAEYAAWVAAGGVEDNLRQHLIGTEVIEPTREDIAAMIRNNAANAKVLEAAYAKLPLA